MSKHAAKQVLSVFAILAVFGAMVPSADSALVNEVSVQPLLNADGSGRLVANSPMGSYGTVWSWEACQIDLSGCEPVATGGEIDTKGAVAETVFRVSSGDAVGFSPVWHGNLTATVAPRIDGVVRANELVKPVAASWRGGWDGDFDQTQLSVCATPTGKRCLSITEPKYAHHCRGEATVLDPGFTGKYLRVADMRFGSGTVFTQESAASPYGHAIWQSDGRTTAAIVGRIRRATGPRRITCGPPALFQALISKAGVATVQCGLGCRAVLIAHRGRRTARSSRKLPRLRGQAVGVRRRATLRLSLQGLSRLGSGRTSMVVMINGERVAHRTISLANTRPPRR